MTTKSINITIEEELLNRSDGLVKKGLYPNRSKLVQDAISRLLKEQDAQFIGEQAKLLTSESEAEEWFEGELEDWQEKY